jgi:segregation and condensation protein A
VSTDPTGRPADGDPALALSAEPAPALSATVTDGAAPAAASPAAAAPDGAALAAAAPAEATGAGSGAAAPPPAMAEALVLRLPQFEGPLDLLLSLIQEHKLDIFDIPISWVTDRYIEFIETARAMNIDLAAEYLLMAATLAHIKSRMLLPREQVSADATDLEPGPDPREELVRRLLEYQKYRQAAQQLALLPQLGRDTFVRRAREELPLTPDEVTWRGSPDLSVYRLIELFARVLRERKIEIPHEVFVERLSIGDRIATITDRLRAEARVTFTSLFADLVSSRDKHRVVPTFLAVLEMAKLKLIKVHQPDPHGEIYLSRTEALLATGAEGVSLDYRG